MIRRLIPRGIVAQTVLFAVGLLVAVQVGSIAVFESLRPTNFTLFEPGWLEEHLPDLAVGALAQPAGERLDWLRARPEAQWLNAARDNAAPADPQSASCAALRDLETRLARETGTRAILDIGRPRGPGRPGPGPLRVLRAGALEPDTAPPDDCRPTPYFSLVLREPEGTWLRIEPPRQLMLGPGLSFLIGWLSMLLIASIAVAWLGFRRLVLPLTALAAAAERFGRGPDTPGLPRPPALPRSGPREIVAISARFDAMRERISRFIAERAAMLAAIGHDLRTPLTRMRLRVERVADPELRAQLSRDIDELETLASETRDFSAIAQAHGSDDKVDLASLAQTIADAHADRGDEVVYHGPRHASVRGRPDALRRAIENLVANALRYAGHATLRLADGDGELRLSIDDSGPGVPESELERVFEPFVRLEESRNRDTGGTGLGLAIARDLVRGHGGEIRLENRREGGLRATIVLPKSA
ncbi:MAG: two-component sensor histidine kinase [Tagaea sp. CACIAM 22H2]|nr:two-component sensor histidine kinase [Tagaea sp. CACIAM 22H2]